jgi:hypothetical protein
MWVTALHGAVKLGEHHPDNVGCPSRFDDPATLVHDAIALRRAWYARL